MKIFFALALSIIASSGKAQSVGTFGTGFGKDVASVVQQSTAQAAVALATNGTNCASGEAARGIDALGNAEGCFVASGASGKVDKAGDTMTGNLFVSGVDGTNGSLRTDGSFISEVFGNIPAIGLWRANGTDSSPTMVLAGDVFGGIFGKSFDGTNPNASTPSKAQVNMFAENNSAPNDVGTNISFVTTSRYTSGNSGRRARMVITSTGTVHFGTFATAETNVGDEDTAQVHITPNPGLKAIDAAGTIKANSVEAGGTNIVYYCSGSTGGTFDGNIARGNSNSGACAGGSWVATSLKVD